MSYLDLARRFVADLGRTPPPQPAPPTGNERDEENEERGVAGPLRSFPSFLSYSAEAVPGREITEESEKTPGGTEPGVW